MPAELYLGPCKLHLDKRKGNISFPRPTLSMRRNTGVRKTRETGKRENQQRVDASSVLNEVK